MMRKSDKKKLLQARPGALVTAASGRIGGAIALTLAEMGYNIALHYRNAEIEALETQKLIEKTGVDCILIKADFNSIEETENLVPEIVKKFSLEVLVNNASEFIKSSLSHPGTEILDRCLNVHLKAPYLLMKSLTEKSNKGLIINILDTKVSQNKTEYFDYLLTKKMLLSLTEMAAFHLAPDFRVNAIAPGLILAPRGENNDYIEKLSKSIPAGQIGEIEQICQSISFFVKNEFVTGQTIFVDGGENIGKINT
ncbi:MAG: SDR family oxidoreductase [Proteobacteria bacterium]|nr:SDR family oxidoreductase [Pseudomonadota bacterium]